MAHRRRLVVAALVAVALAATAVAFASAQESRLGGKVRAGNAIVVPATETWPDSLYLFGGTVTMSGTVNGDLMVAGGTNVVDGTVHGDVLAAGGTTTITGTVDGDVRAAGGQVTVGGPVGGDLVVGGGQLSLTPGGRVGKDLIFSAGQARIDGAVAGSIEGNSGDYARTGSVGGTESVTRTAQPPSGQTAPANPVVGALQQFVAVVVIGALALWLLPGLVRRAEASLRERPLVALGSGVLAIVGYIVAIIVIVIVVIVLGVILGLLRLDPLVVLDIIGGLILLAVVTFGFAVASVFLVDAIVGLGIARLSGVRAEASIWRELGLLVVGAAIVVILTSIPVIGGLVKLVVVLFGLGALLVAMYGAWRERRLRGAPRAPGGSQPVPPSAPPAQPGPAGS